MIRWTRWLGGVIAAAALLTLSSPVWAQSRPSVGTNTNTAPLGITPPSCNSNSTQSFLVGTGSTELSGCPSNDLAIGSYYFPWTMDVNVAGNYSTATYTQVTWQPGGVSSGAYAWYGEMYIYNSTTSAGEFYYDQLDCKAFGTPTRPSTQTTVCPLGLTTSSHSRPCG
jgi:hypothetical protein